MVGKLVQKERSFPKGDDSFPDPIHIRKLALETYVAHRMQKGIL